MRWRHALLAGALGWLLPMVGVVGAVALARRAWGLSPGFALALIAALFALGAITVLGPSTLYRALGIAEATRAADGPRVGVARALGSALSLAAAHTALRWRRALRGAWTFLTGLSLIVVVFPSLLALSLAAVSAWVTERHAVAAVSAAIGVAMFGTYALQFVPRALRRAAVRRLATRLAGSRSRPISGGVHVEGQLDGRRCVARLEPTRTGDQEQLSIELSIGARAVPFALERAELAERVARRLGRALAGEAEERVEDRLRGGDAALQAGHSSEALAALAALLERHDLDRVVMTREGKLSVAALDRALFDLGRAPLEALLRDLAALAPLFARAQVRVREREAFGFTRAGGGLVCPFCRDALDEAQAVACEGCATAHHDECLREAGGCTVFGCDAAPAPRARDDAPPKERV